MEIAKEGKNITSLMEWPRSKKMFYIAALMFGILANYGTNFALTSVGNQIATELGSPELFSLVFTVPMFAMIVLQPACNWFGQKFGIGKVLIISQLAMLLQCVMILLAPSMEVVIFARCIANVSNAFLMAVGLGAYALMFEPDECSKWNGVFGTTISFAICFFPFIAGVLFDATGIWKLAFTASLIAAAVGLILSCIACPPRSAEPKAVAPLDFAGLAAMGVCVVVFLYLFTFGGTQFPWVSAITLILVVLTIVGGVAFVKIEAKKGDAALVPLRMFKHRAFLVALLAGVFLFPDAILVTYLPTYAQVVLGQSATIGSLFSSAPGLLAVFASTAFGILLEKKGCFKALFVMSTVLAGGATVGLIFLDSSVSIYLVLIVITATWGTAYSIFKFIPGAIVQAKVPAEDAPLCFNLVQIGLGIGTTFALALAGIPLTMFADNPALAYDIAFTIALVGVIVASLIVIFGLKDEKK